MAIASEKEYTWTPDTPKGFLNDEFENLWESLVQNSGDTMTGQLVIDTGSSSPFKIISTSGYTWNFRTQDGENRMAMYWNTLGGASPTFVTGTEPAGMIGLTPTSNLLFKIAQDDSSTHAANDPITWQRLFTVFGQGGFQSALDLAGTSGGNIFYSNTTGNKRGGWNPYLDTTNHTDGRILAQYKTPTNVLDAVVLGDPHQHKHIYAYKNASQTVSGGTATDITWSATWLLDDIYTWLLATNPDEVTVLKVGWYLIDFDLVFEETAGADRWLGKVELMKNGNPQRTMFSGYIRGAGGVDYASANGSFLIYLQANDIVKLTVTEVSSTSVTVVVPASPISYLNINFVGTYRA